jgi:plastocyanin
MNPCPTARDDLPGQVLHRRIEPAVGTLRGRGASRGASSGFQTIQRAWVLVVLTGSIASAAATQVSFRIVDTKGSPVQDAAISLVPLDGPAPAVTPAKPPEIEQHGQEFSPYVTIVRTGTSVRFPNRDTVEHHVYSESPAKRFELPLYAPGKAEIIVFDRPGIVPLGCNIHDWMLAYVVVVDTPWFTRTPATGTAGLEVPPGRYRAEVWHPRLGRVEKREIVVPTGAAEPAPAEFTLALKPDRRIRRPVDQRQGGYR